MRGDDCVFVFSIAHGGVCQGVCPLFFEFYEEIQKLFTRAFPPRTPRHPKLKFGEVVEVIILLYYLGCRTQKKKSVLLGDFARPCGKARAGGQKKKKKIPMYYKTPIYVLESLSDSFSVLSSTLLPLRQQLK